MFLFHRLWLAPLLMLGFASLPGCTEPPGPKSHEVAAVEPTQAVTRLVSDLRDDDLTGYARHAVPPALYAQLDAAWREDRSRWPLTGLPLHGRLPGLLTTLAEPGAEKALLTVYRRQFAGAHGELRSAAATLGLFAVQYLQREGDYSTEERDHYIQLTGALSQWGKRAPLGDSKQAQIAIPQLVSAARLTGLAGDGRFRDLGMERSLRRLGPFFGRFKRVLVGYGLDLDAALDTVEVTVAEQAGDTARLRLRYTIAGREVDAHLRAERVGGQWYLADVIRHARAQASAPDATFGTTADRPAR